MSIRSGWIKSFFLFLCIGFAGGVPTHGQVLQLARFEIPMGDSETESFKVVPVKEKGMLVYRKIFSTDGQVIEISRIDTALHQAWKRFITVERNVQIKRTAVFEGNLFILLQNPLNAIGNFQVLAISSENSDYVLHKVNNLIPFSPIEFVVTRAAFLIGGYFNYRPLVLHYGFVSQKARILPGFLNEPGELMQVKAYDNGSIDIIVGAKNLDKRKCLWIRNYDAEGTLNKVIILDPGPKKNLIFGQSVKMPNDEQVVAGVYGRYTDYSRGLFVATINPYGEYQVNYYNFADLQNFFNYLKAKRVKRIKERIERRKVKGKMVRFNYRFLVHTLVPYKDKYILVGEAFYPSYHYVSYGAGFGYPFRNDLVFDGYRYTHAVVIGFSKNGKIIWDNSFEINDIKSFQLEQFVKIHPEENRIVLLYMFQNSIRSKTINDDKVLDGKTNENIKIESPEWPVEILDTESTKLDYWYGDNFYACGVQYVKHRYPQNEEPKKVFFVTKITYP